MNDLLERFRLQPHVTPHTSSFIGQKFSRLTILAIGKKPNTYRYMAVCQCDCGKGPFPIRLDKVQSGHTRSCGCLHPEAITKHGEWDHPLYPVWRNMLLRCHNPNDSSYQRYGARGIRVCDRWHDLKNFLADMQPSYRKGLQLERVNNDANYCPENCRWASHSEQQRNKRSNINITIDGKTKCLAEWCRDFGTHYQLAWERIKKQGWDAERAVRTPPRPINP